jgi:cupin-like protein
MSEVLESPKTRRGSDEGSMIVLDRDLFRERFNRRHFVFRHHLSDHPLFKLPRLIELARSTAAARADDLYYDAGVQDIRQRWGTAPSSFPVDETIKRIQNAGAWIVLKRAENDPSYAAVLDRCMSDILEVSGRELERKMRRREVIVFITSPNRLTTYHIDSENNFLLQLSGRKDISLFRPEDREVTTEQEIERFYSVDTNSATYKPHLQHHAEVVTMEPGMGVHIPVNAPHWLKNGDNISISVSINYHSYDSERAAIYRTNYYLRRMGLNPTPPFRSPILDQLKRPVGVALGQLHDRFRFQLRKP